MWRLSPNNVVYFYLQINNIQKYYSISLVFLLLFLCLHQHKQTTSIPVLYFQTSLIILFTIFFYYSFQLGQLVKFNIIDDAQNHQWVDCPHTCQLGYLKNKKNEEPTESTDGVPAKSPSKVKSVIEKSSITQECKG